VCDAGYLFPFVIGSSDSCVACHRPKESYPKSAVLCNRSEMIYVSEDVPRFCPLLFLFLHSCDLCWLLGRVFSVNFSGDATYVLSGSDDTNIRVWKAKASEQLGVVCT